VNQNVGLLITIIC